MNIIIEWLLVLTGSALTLIGLVLCCRHGGQDRPDASFFDLHSPDRAAADRARRAQLAEFNADNRIARGCHWAELYMWEAEDPAGVDPWQPAQPETDGPWPGTGTVTS